MFASVHAQRVCKQETWTNHIYSVTSAKGHCHNCLWLQINVLIIRTLLLLWLNQLFYLDKCIATQSHAAMPLCNTLNHKPWTQIEINIQHVAWLRVAQYRDNKLTMACQSLPESLSLISTQFKRPRIAYLLKKHGKHGIRLILACLSCGARSNRLNLDRTVKIGIIPILEGVLFVKGRKKMGNPPLTRTKRGKLSLFRAHG